MYFVELRRVMALIDVLFANASPNDIKEIKEKFSKITEEKAKELSIIDS
jgi:hypothetical protein